MTIAIDGPAGAGKSTAAKLAAKKLGMHYVDTGAMYRAIAWAILNDQPDDEAAYVEALEISLSYEQNVQHVYVGGRDVSDLIRTPRVSAAASRLAKEAFVRNKLLELERRTARDFEVIMDGRDIGTVVLPDAELKIYITADTHERALRRARELEEKNGAAVDLSEIEREIIERDERDMHREIAPLRKADDAILLDTTTMSIDEVTEAIVLMAEKKRIG